MDTQVATGALGDSVDTSWYLSPIPRPHLHSWKWKARESTVALEAAIIDCMAITG